MRSEEQMKGGGARISRCQSEWKRSECWCANSAPRPHFLILALMMVNVWPVCVQTCALLHNKGGDLQILNFRNYFFFYIKTDTRSIQIQILTCRCNCIFLAMFTCTLHTCESYRCELNHFTAVLTVQPALSLCERL